jgi:hypothetical protein
MADWELDPEDYITLRDEVIEEYEIDWSNGISNDEMTQEDFDRLSELHDKKLVWTEHGTCEDNWLAAGFTQYGECELLGHESSGCGCWQSYSYYVAKKPWVNENEHVLVTATLPCSVCNPDGDGDGVEGCEGPEVPEGADRSECSFGTINWYFD